MDVNWFWLAVGIVGALVAQRLGLPGLTTSALPTQRPLLDLLTQVLQTRLAEQQQPPPATDAELLALVRELLAGKKKE